MAGPESETPVLGWGSFQIEETDPEGLQVVGVPANAHSTADLRSQPLTNFPGSLTLQETSGALSSKRVEVEKLLWGLVDGAETGVCLPFLLHPSPSRLSGDPQAELCLFSRISIVLYLPPRAVRKRTRPETVAVYLCMLCFP